MQYCITFAPLMHIGDIPYSGLFLKQKLLQERQNLNFEELNFQGLQISKTFN